MILGNKCDDRSAGLMACALWSIPVVLLSIVVSGCQYNPFAHRFLKREPSVEEVVGTYSLEEVYVDMVEAGLNEKIRARSPKPTIVLRSDGVALLRSFPIFNNTDQGFDYEFIGFEDVETRWKVLPVGSVSSGGDDSTTVYGLSLDLPESRLDFRWPTFTGEQAVDGLIFTLYDGDQGQILGYKKGVGEKKGGSGQ